MKVEIYQNQEPGNKKKETGTIYINELNGRIVICTALKGTSSNEFKGLVLANGSAEIFHNPGKIITCHNQHYVEFSGYITLENT